ncbi:hypothetical protein [Paenibacillus senegalensis]|uniref:hypothetical protein n=1 Tax=Paenibacillus senegalensis TaxID=1465766 RepID=UPI00028A3CB7|nr:hypothetical protein [Paenibacillus senegalensis]
MIIFLWAIMLIGFVFLVTYALAKKNKWLIISSAAGVVILLGIQLYSYKSYSFPTFVETVQLNWEVSLPEPSALQPMVAARGGLQGEGDDYTIVEYEDPASINLVSQSVAWSDRTTDNEQQVREYIQSLRDNYELEEEASKNLTTLSDMLDKPYRFYKKEHADGESFAYFLWFPEEGRLHVLEYNHQDLLDSMKPSMKPKN